MRPAVLRWALVMGLTLLLLIGSHVWLLRAMASILIAEDPLAPAAAIVVLAGHPPFREMEAAELYRAGWAPRVVVLREVLWEEEQAFAQLGIAVPERWELSHRVLTTLGVPAEAIVTPPERAQNTFEELAIALRALDPRDQPVILVTSKVHTRRVGLTWRYLAGGRSPGLTRPTRYDPFDVDRWWLEGRFLTQVTREYAGLVGYAARFLQAHGR